MAITKQQKKEMLQSLEDKITKAKSIVFVGYDKVKINDQDNLRKSLKKEGSELMVAKKTLLKLALKNLKIVADTKEINLENETAVAFGYEDEVTPAKIISQVSRLAKNIKIKGGVLENKMVDAEKMIFLSSLPSKQILQAQFLNVLKSPIYGLANVLQGNLRGLVCILSKLSQNT